MLDMLVLKRHVNETWQNVGLEKKEVGCEDRSGRKGWTRCVREAHPWREFEQLTMNVSHSDFTGEVPHLVLNRLG